MFSGGGSKEVDDNSLVFKLFTRNTVYLFLFAAAFISLNQVMKDPIDCWKTPENNDSEPLDTNQKSLFENYCWTHASQEVDYKKYTDGFCIKDQVSTYPPICMYTFLARKFKMNSFIVGCSKQV